MCLVEGGGMCRGFGSLRRLVRWEGVLMPGCKQLRGVVPRVSWAYKCLLRPGGRFSTVPEALS